MKPTNILLFVSSASRALSASIERSRDGSQQSPMGGAWDQRPLDPEAAPGHEPWLSKAPSALQELLDALEVMQDTYFDIFTGIWPDAIDWTAAVMGTHVSATLSSIVASLDASESSTCSDMLSWQNIVDRYFAHTSAFYFGENVFALRNQAFDDMLWVVLGWLENLKFAEMYSLKHWDFVQSGRGSGSGGGWHGLQFTPLAAHRARIFYDLASNGWDESLCGGGMNWNPYLTPYKNAITNELFAAASIAMYLYFPGDNNTSPYFSATDDGDDGFVKPHSPVYLENAIKAYKWLTESHMCNATSGLWQDGFHVTGWHRYPNGTINRGTGVCDELNPMVYTYNQGVLLSACRGLWMATGSRSYLEDGHALVASVIRATGWPEIDAEWRGLGRGGVLEEACDHGGYCSQDGQTFKGIFFHHLSEFCRPMWPQENAIFAALANSDYDPDVYQYHLSRCATYDKWIRHNANAALATKNPQGRFGMWWTFQQPNDVEMEEIERNTVLESGANDHLNPKPSGWLNFPLASSDWNDRGRGRTVETQSGGLAVLKARWNWQAHLNQVTT